MKRSSLPHFGGGTFVHVLVILHLNTCGVWPTKPPYLTRYDPPHQTESFSANIAVYQVQAWILKLTSCHETIVSLLPRNFLPFGEYCIVQTLSNESIARYAPKGYHVRKMNPNSIPHVLPMPVPPRSLPPTSSPRRWATTQTPATNSLFVLKQLLEILKRRADNPAGVGGGADGRMEGLRRGPS